MPKKEKTEKEETEKKSLRVETEVKQVLRKDKSKIKRIVHISDIHIRKDSRERFDEYSKVFNNLERELKKLNLSRDNSLIVITGDICDSDHCMKKGHELLYKLYSMLIKFCDVLSIPGNHDISSSYDCSIEPIILNIQGKNNNFFLSNRGEYLYANLVFGYTPIDQSVYKIKNSNKKLIKLGLYHGAVESKNSPHFLDQEGNLLLEDFEKEYSYTLFGDIHKTLYFDKSHYCGSLVQNRHLEDFKKGFVVLDLDTFERTFIKVDNDYGFLKLEIEEDGKVYVLNGLDEIKEKDKRIKFDPLYKYPKFLRLKIINRCKKNKALKNVIKILEKKSTLIEKKIDEDIENDYEIELENGKKKKVDLKNIDNKDYLLKLICGNTDIDKDNKRVCDKLKGIINLAEILLESKKIQIKKIIMINFMGYKRLELDFDKIRSFAKCIGDNNLGKSTLYEGVLFATFGIVSKDTDRASFIRFGEGTCDSTIELCVNNKTYRIVRALTSKGKTKKYKDPGIVHHLSFFEDDKDITCPTREETDLLIESKICGYKDYLTQAIIKGSEGSFLSFKETERRNILTRMAGLDRITEINTKAKQKATSINSSIRECERILRDYDDFGDTVTDIRIGLKNKLEKQNKDKKEKDNLLKKESESLDELNKNYFKVEQELERLKGINVLNLNEKEEKKLIDGISKKLASLDLELNNLVKEREKYDKIDKEFEKYNDSKNKKLKKLKEEINGLHSKILHEQKTEFLKEIKKERKELEKEIGIMSNKQKKIKIKKYTKKQEKNIISRYEDQIKKSDECKKIEDFLEKENIEFLKIEKRLAEFKDYKYDKKCKYCCENSLTKTKLQLQKTLEDYKNSIKERERSISNLKIIIEDKKIQKDYNEYEKNKNKIEEFDNLEDDLRRSSERIKEIDILISDNEKNIRDNEKIMQEIDKKQEEINNYPKFTKYEHLNKINNMINETKGEINLLTDHKNKKMFKIEEYQKNKRDINDKQKYEEEFISIEKDLKLKKDYVSKIANELNSIREEIGGLKRDIELVTKTGERKNKLKQDFDDYKMIEKCVGEKFINLILEKSILIKLENMVNIYMKEMKLGEIKIIQHLKKIRIYDKKNGRPIGNAGKYQLNMLSLIFSVCINNISIGPKSSNLFLDEIMDGSYQTNIPRVVELLNKIRGLSNYKNIILITHNEEIKNYNSGENDTNINIKRINDNTRILKL